MQMNAGLTEMCVCVHVHALLTFSIYGVTIINTSCSLDSLKVYMGVLLLKNTVIFPSQN